MSENDKGIARRRLLCNTIGASNTPTHLVEKNMKNSSASDKVLHLINWAKYLVIGAIGGIAIVNTVAMVVNGAPGQSIENIAMGAGAIVAAAIAKGVHLL